VVETAKPLDEADPSLAGFLLKLATITGKPAVEPVSTQSPEQTPGESPKSPG
jgi:hypothetical protein